MHFERLSHPEHAGRETYAVTYALKNQDDLYDVQGDYVKFTIRPEMLTLHWERYLGSPWRIFDGYGHGTRISGRRVLKSGDLGDQVGYVSLFWQDELNEYAKSIPGLADLVAKAKSQLPA